MGAPFQGRQDILRGPSVPRMVLEVTDEHHGVGGDEAMTIQEAPDPWDHRHALRSSLTYSVASTPFQTSLWRPSMNLV